MDKNADVVYKLKHLSSSVERITRAMVARRILLVGGDEFRAAGRDMDRSILALTGKAAPRAAIIPTAAALENPQRAAANGVRHFTALGATAYSVAVIERADAEDAGLASQVGGADLIYFTGGSPEHLHAVLAGSLLLDAVTAAYAAGAIWAGSSAGAMVLGEGMRRPASGSALSPALNIIPGIMVLPHHEGSDPAAVAAQRAARGEAGLTGLGIDGGTGALLDANGAAVLGSGSVTVYRGRGWERYAAGDVIPNLTVDGPAG